MLGAWSGLNMFLQSEDHVNPDNDGFHGQGNDGHRLLWALSVSLALRTNQGVPPAAPWLFYLALIVGRAEEFTSGCMLGNTTINSNINIILLPVIVLCNLCAVLVIVLLVPCSSSNVIVVGASLSRYTTLAQTAVVLTVSSNYRRSVVQYSSIGSSICSFRQYVLVRTRYQI